MLGINKISIDNVKDNETIHHSFLLLKITVTHATCNSAPGDTELKVSVANNETTVFFQTTKVNNTYKCLTELKLGESRISLSFCCICTGITVKYTNRVTQFQIVPIYIINDGHDGKFQAPETETNTVESACARILTGCKLLQCFIAEKLKEDDFGRKTFQIDFDSCSVFKSGLRWDIAVRMTQYELWSYLGREIMHSEIGCSRKKYFGFLSCTKYKGSERVDETNTHEKIIGLTDGYVALGGGGLALFGTACLYTWPENIYEVISRFEDGGIVDRTRFMDDSCYRGTLGACFSTTLGSALHELCHTFDLGHTEEGIMGRGFDNIGEFFTSNPNNSDDLVRVKPTVRPKCSSVVIKVGKKSSNTIIRNPTNTSKNFRKRKGNAETYFTLSSSALLCYHKFFNDFSSCDQDFILTFDRATRLLKSTRGIRVIEIREDGHEMVTEHWIFNGRVLKFSFEVPTSFKDNFILVVEDNAGNILKDFCTKS